MTPPHKTEEKPKIQQHHKTEKKEEKLNILDHYSYTSDKVPVAIKIYKKKGEFVPIYHAAILNIGKHTDVILERIRQELIQKVKINMEDLGDFKKTDIIKEKFRETIQVLIKEYFPEITPQVNAFFTSYLMQKSIGLGDIEIIRKDENLEEIAVNGAHEPVWVYHKKYGWLKTNIMMSGDAHIKHISTTIGRDVGRQINTLEPLMDASLLTGDRVNATLMPISTKGNTITIRKFAEKPFTITDMIKMNTISPSGAALIWSAIHFEMSGLVAGGTGSGKTSILNVMAHFFPPNQRIISIEDTREIVLPNTLHWVPMLTRLPNAEGRGQISMLDLVVNSLRMRPDRIIVGEIRRQKEAEVLFEAIHTGHSVYATVHANDTKETISRLTNPPIALPKSVLPALSFILVQHRNRRTGVRRTFQISEIDENGEARILKQLDLKRDILVNKEKSKSMMETLEMHVGLSENEVKRDLTDKENVIKWLVKHGVNDVNQIGKIMAEYYERTAETQ